MLTLGEFEKCRLYIESHSKEKEKNKRLSAGPCITISRETGTSAKLVSEELIKFFIEKTKSDKSAWTIFDKNLIEKVLIDHNLPETLKNLMIEDKVSYFASMLNEMLSGLPGQWTLIHKEGETILHLASLGNSIIIGRGANVITQNLSNTFHIRLIAPINERIKRFAELHSLDCERAKLIVELNDIRRRKYLHSVFNKKIDDLSFYHLVINTKSLTYRQTAEIIGLAVIKKFPEMFKEKVNSYL
jgi:hypothetical protein